MCHVDCSVWGCIIYWCSLTNNMGEMSYFGEPLWGMFGVKYFTYISICIHIFISALNIHMCRC